jgi:2-polyprenyl-3-methyl-5-hydroxy-6-metoxy-1,4-benzoquinol methylase
MHNNTVYEWILSTTFTTSARAMSLQEIAPHLSAFVHSGDDILDLCCGTGFVSFWLAEQGARVTGIDFAIEQHIVLGKDQFLDLFTKRSQ